MRKNLALIACIAAGFAFISAAMIEGLRYSPDGDPGAPGIMIWLGAAGLALWAIPAIAVVVWFFRELRASARAAGLTPVQAAMLEAVAMEGTHLAWAAHNRRVDAELSASVMGRPGTEGPDAG